MENLNKYLSSDESVVKSNLDKIKNILEDTNLKMLELEEVKTKKKEDIKKIKKDLKSVENKKAQIKIKRDNKIKGIIVDLLIENLNEQDENADLRLIQEIKFLIKNYDLKISNGKASKVEDFSEEQDEIDNDDNEEFNLNDLVKGNQ
ncbi:hypothetical protein AM202_00130 [Actinobacillus minor 202]|uniref:Uncharacterized protein n=1 Tax=Actinobacillus minor 202 TaxID=591023 RepID=A0ABP2GTG3_9PAST|nr:hypothetical protein [Actinobacillus minor]EEV24586.1 hypothetical protein AM202_00130 [Actinobacillus minor 202]